MCGIAGIINYGGVFSPLELEGIASRMRETMVHRGPDDAGTWVSDDGLCALAHRRLSILDLSEHGRQPMLTEDGQSAVCFNGEIYNYIELREQFEREGVRFRTSSDTEVLLELMREFDATKLNHLEGMYAFAIWESGKRRLSLARDAFGKKPLYLAEGNGWLAFASELRAFREIPGFRPAIDLDALHEYILLQYVPAPRTIFVGCSKLEPGSFATFDVSPKGITRNDGVYFRFQISDVCHPAPPPDDPERHFEELAEEFQPILQRAVARRLRSDVPVGAFLSGGIDSALVVATITKELDTPVQSFTIGFEGVVDSEHTVAREAGLLLGTQHLEKVLKPNVMSLLPRIARALDEPLGDSSCLPTFLLSEFCRQRVTVSLSGDGGDELFGGYKRYRKTLREGANRWRHLAHLLTHRSLWRLGSRYFDDHLFMLSRERLRGLIGTADGGSTEALAAGWVDELNHSSSHLLDRMRVHDAAHYLPGAVLTKVDRMSMAHGLEVRSPFLDREVASFASRLSGDNCYRDDVLKPVLRKLATRYLPKDYIERPKMGFGLPKELWARDGLRDLCDLVSLGRDGRLAEYLERDRLSAYLEWAWTRRKPPIYSIWNLLLMEHWLRENEL